MEAIRGFYENYIRWSAASMTLSDVLEIAIFTYFIYHIILWIKQSKAWILLKGAAAIFAMYILAVILQLNNIVMVFNRIAPYVATALLVIFQPEIRRALEQLGTNHLNFFRFLAQKIKLQKMQMILLMRLFVHPLAWGVQRQEH